MNSFGMSYSKSSPDVAGGMNYQILEIIMQKTNQKVEKILYTKEIHICGLRIVREPVSPSGLHGCKFLQPAVGIFTTDTGKTICA